MTTTIPPPFRHGSACTELQQQTTQGAGNGRRGKRDGLLRAPRLKTASKMLYKEIRKEAACFRRYTPPPWHLKSKGGSNPFQARIGESDWIDVSGGGQNGVIPCLVGGIQKGQRPIRGPSAPIAFLFPPRALRGLRALALGGPAGEECSTVRSMRDRVVCNPGSPLGACAKRRRGPGMLPGSTSPLFPNVAVGPIWIGPVRVYEQIRMIRPRRINVNMDCVWGRDGEERH